MNWIGAAIIGMVATSETDIEKHVEADMVSAISRILSFDRPFSRAIKWLGSVRRRPKVIRVEDLPDDLLQDIGFEISSRIIDPRADVWRRNGGLGDYLRTGPM